MNRVLGAVILLPRNIIVVLLKGYRAVISPLYGDVCRYYPSCSHYTLQAVQHHGAVRGTWLGARRIARCHPWARGGVDDIPEVLHEHFVISRFGFAVPAARAAVSQGKG